MFAKKIEFMQNVYAFSEHFRVKLNEMECNGFIPECDLPCINIKKGDVFTLVGEDIGGAYYEVASVAGESVATNYKDITFDMVMYLDWQDKKVFTECVEDETRITLFLCTSCGTIASSAGAISIEEYSTTLGTDACGKVIDFAEPQGGDAQDVYLSPDSESCIRCGNTLDLTVCVQITKESFMAASKEVRESIVEGISIADFVNLVTNNTVELVEDEAIARLTSLVV